MDSDTNKNAQTSNEDYHSRFEHLKEVFFREAEFEDDAESPPVNVEVLQKYLNDETSSEEEQYVEQMLRKYRPWVDALRGLEGGDDLDAPSQSL